jgi:cell division protein ZapB
MVERAIAVCNTRLLHFPGVFRLTALVERHYSFHMAESSRTSSLDVEFKRLEKRLEELVSTVHRLKDENRALRARQDSLAAEKTTVMNRSEQVRARVEAMIGRLKAMERTA